MINLAFLDRKMYEHTSVLEVDIWGMGEKLHPTEYWWV